MFSLRSPLCLFSVCALLLAMPLGAQELSINAATFSVDVADASTYVNVAKVNLSVGTMTIKDGKLLGTYSIQVPILKSQCEKGTIVLPLMQEMHAYACEGGTICGQGFAEGFAEGEITGHRKIVACFSPYEAEKKGGRITLTIHTGKRVLVFESTYRMNDD